MIKQFWYKLLNSVTGGAILIAFFSIISKIIGLLRDRLLASTFGADYILDVYYASFRVPDLIFNTLVLGALSAAFIPIFVRLWETDKQDAFKLANIVIVRITLALIILSIIAIAFTPQLINFIAPGFDGDQFSLAIELTRIMLLSIIFFGISNVLSGILNSVKDFIPYAIAPIFYNLGIILGIVILYPLCGVIGLAYGVTLGSILHLLVQIPSVYKRGWRFNFVWKITTDVRKIFNLMIPRMIGMAANQINQVVITSIASTLAVGSIAIFNLANNLQNFPVSIFGLSLAIAAFPIFSKAWVDNRPDDFRGSFSITLRKILFFIIPISVLVLVLRAQIVRLVLGAGYFDWEDTYFTAQVLGIFALSLFAQGTVPLLARAFYSLEDTKTPVYISLISVALNLVLSFSLAAKFGVLGLAMAFSIANVINMLLLLIVLREKLGDLDDKNVINSVFKISVNSLLSGFVAYGLLYFIAPAVDMQTFLGILIQASLAALGATIIYFILSIVTNVSEIRIINKFIREFIKPNIFKSDDRIK